MIPKNISRKNEPKRISLSYILVCIIAFLLGCLATASILLNIQARSTLHSSTQYSKEFLTETRCLETTPDNKNPSIHSILQNKRLLIAIAAYDFSQIPHLEEVLDAYHDVCIAGAAQVDVVIHATVPYPVTLLDLWNARFPCPHFSLQIVLKPASLRLHLVDCHRQLFYDHLQQYDLFIYSEDDIRVTPTTIATYCYETKRLEQYLTTTTTPTKYQPADFNIGIVRYEYNYPANVIIDDKTRHATQNVTRVYWEHSGFQRPVVPNAVKDVLEDDTLLQQKYFTMSNHHQGMFLATRELLTAWQKRCNFHIASNRPGKGAQPTEGTQRVWMSSQMLYGCRHGCCVKQLLPKDRSFGALTVLHLPNKNYRRVGKYRQREFADGTEVFQQPSSTLLTDMELHLGMRKVWPPEPQIPYRGIRMNIMIT
ncbi:hypothetical protein FisN_11Lh210 [Fistulifera solaris]|uniref:Uncharacterized protein n=1 Tax=Fistulifera solaris TaxID=1519565 RepID=A0A1Z5J742_FISSO|nr:hypothetical protein FisN_11Lh210 [Fistulifera solaris]|eukprot:GAX09815.1 hypothetical protein FisN_11Lh210 [Fistulifera solaris]